MADDIQFTGGLEVGRDGDRVTLAVGNFLTLRLTEAQAQGLAGRLLRECGIEFAFVPPASAAAKVSP